MENTVNQDATINNEPTQTPEGNERTFSQADVDNVVSERLKRERAKYSDYEELKAKAAKLDEIEEANKTELQKATERATELETELNGLKKANEIRSIRDKVSNETGVPVNLLTGEDEESCAAQAKEILAYELTKLVHGEEEAEKAQASARALFSTGDSENMPSVALADEDFTEGKIDILGMLVKAGLVASRGEARRALEQGGVTANGEKVTDTKATFTKEQIGEGVVLRRGKKAYKKVTL